MSASILSRPTKSGCNWNALGNPVIFKVVRADHGISGINNVAGFAQLQYDGIDLTAYYQLGNTVSVINGGHVEFETGTITASSFSTNTVVTTTIPYADVIVYTGPASNNLSKRTDYRVEYNFKSIAGIELIGADQAVSPDLAGVMIVNASLLKNILSATWTLPVAVNEVDADGSIGFYLSYQEYYDGALQGSVTNDSANPIQGLLGANQIGSADGSNMLAYFLGSSSKKFLTRFQLNSALKGLKMWRDWPYTVSFIWPDGVVDIYARYFQYDASGTVLSNSSVALIANDNAINRLPAADATDNAVRQVIRLAAAGASFASVTITNGTFTGSSTGWSNVGGGQSWVYSANTVTITNLSAPATSAAFLQVLSSPITTASESKIRMTINISAPVGKNIIVYISRRVTGGAVGTAAAQLVVGDGTNHAVLVSSSVLTSSTDNIDELGFLVESLDAIAGTIIVDSVAFEFAQRTLLAEDLDIEIDDACEYDEDNLPIPGQNPIMLQWKNSLGGDAQWLFPFYHESSYNLKGRKAKRLILFDQDLSAVQWEALQELISTNEVYSPPIIDLENTNTINYTSKQVGKQVYMLDQDGNKAGVIVIPNSDRINARDPSHRIAIEIELPEFQEA